MKMVTKTDEYRDRIQAEWLVYMCDSSIVDVQSDYDATGNICLYWEKMSEVSDDVGGKKYACLSFLAKTSFTTIAHGNAIPERGFSVNNAMLGKESLAFEEHTIVANSVVKDIIQLYG